ITLLFVRFGFFFTATPTTLIYTLSLHDALPIFIKIAAAVGIGMLAQIFGNPIPIPLLEGKTGSQTVAHHRQIDGALHTSEVVVADRKSTRLNSSHVKISYAVFCLKKNKNHYPLM